MASIELKRLLQNKGADIATLEGRLRHHDL